MIDAWDGRSSTLRLLQSATEDEDRDALVQVHYLKVQPMSPEFASKYGGINQNIEIELSTFVFSASPRPVIALYDFIMATFVSNNNASPTEAATSVSSPASPDETLDGATNTKVNETQATPGKIRLNLGLTSVKCTYIQATDSNRTDRTCCALVILLDVSTRIATLTLSTAKVGLTLENRTMRVGVQLGSLSLMDDSSQPTNVDAYKELVTIEGSNLLDLTYEIFDTHMRFSPGGADSAVTLRSGSIKIHFLERPLHDLYSFMIKFARLKSLYDSATQAAVQRASEIQKMKFDVSIQSPVIIFPDQSLQSDQRLVIRLGEVSARNGYLDTAAEINASLRGISLASEVLVDGEVAALSIVDAVDINTNIIQHLEEHCSDANPAPETEV
jgi:vacuolar protein sorting-associated protein 13A/C